MIGLDFLEHGEIAYNFESSVRASLNRNQDLSTSTPSHEDIFTVCDDYDPVIPRKAALLAAATTDRLKLPAGASSLHDLSALPVTVSNLSAEVDNKDENQVSSFAAHPLATPVVTVQQPIKHRQSPTISQV